MKQSQLFYKTARHSPKDEKSINAQLLIRAGFIEKVAAGIYNFLPLGFRVMKKIERIIREEMEKIDGQEILMPALHPKELWQKTKRWYVYEDLYKLKDGNRDFALGPTHEEIVVPLAKNFIHGYQDLPLCLFQIQTKFRKEKRVKSGLLRTREFLMKDLYSFHANEKDLNEYYERAKKAYFEIFERAGLGKETFLTYASGGTFSKYSHEFQTITVAGEDTIYVCQGCFQAINKEIKPETEKCPNCGKTQFKEQRAIEVGNIFKLRTRFSEPFDLSFIDKDGKKKFVEMGCYGIGVGRLMGTVVEVFHDDKGIIWPGLIAPFTVHLVEIPTKNSRVRTETEKVYEALEKEKIEVLYDDREKSAGEKLVESDLIGIPLRLIVSERNLEKNLIEVKGRNAKGADFIKITNLNTGLRKYLPKDVG